MGAEPVLDTHCGELARLLGEKRCRAERAATRKGILFPVHRRHLVALPRISLNCDYQSLTQTALYLSGASFALWNLFQQSAPLDGRAAAST